MHTYEAFTNCSMMSEYIGRQGNVSSFPHLHNAFICVIPLVNGKQTIQVEAEKQARNIVSHHRWDSRRGTKFQPCPY